MLDLIRILAIARKNLHAYGPGHPAMEASLATAHRRLGEMVAAGGRLTFGVARDALIHGQEKLDSGPARDLARTLYLRDVALISFEPGLELAELRAFLKLLGGEVASAGRPPLAEELASAGVTHVRLEAVDFSQVRATEELEASPPSPPNLLEEMLKALLEGRQVSAEGERLIGSGEAASVPGLAALVKEVLTEATGGGTGAGPASVAPALGSAVRRHLVQAVGAQRLLALNQVAELVRALPLEIREEVVAAAVSALAGEDGAEALETLSKAVAPHTLLRALRRLADEMPLSPHLLRLLRALSASQPAAGGGGQEPDPALLAALSALFRNEDHDRYNPEDHQALLENAAIEVPAVDEAVREDLGPRLQSLDEDAVAQQLAQTCLEMVERLGPREGVEKVLRRLEAAFLGFIAEDRLEAAARLAEQMRDLAAATGTVPETRAWIEDAMAHMASRESLAGLLDALHRRGQETAALARRLIDALGAAAGRAFLLALVDEVDASRRRQLLDLLISIGPAIVPQATFLLSDTRWYVVRNMIVLLRRLGGRTSLAEVRRCAAHPDLRVRLEAIKCLLAVDPQVSAALLEKAIRDPDPKLAETAVALAGSYGIAEAVGPLLDIVDSFDLLGRRRSLRLKALKSLGELANPEALPRLARYFRNWRLPLVAREERRAAFRALASYPEEARAALVRRGMRSSDREIRRICARLPAPSRIPPPEGGEG